MTSYGNNRKVYKMQNSPIPTLTLKSGCEIPKIGLGTWMVGGSSFHDPKNDDQSQIAAIKYAIDNGVRMIRTAQNYAGGYAETIVGNAIKGFERDSIFIATAANENVATDVASIENELRGSLDRLGVDHVDLFLMGGINPSVSQREIANGLQNLLDKKLTVDIGVGNYRQSEFEYLNTLLDGKLVYNELHYNLIIREPEVTQLDKYLQKEKVVLSAYRPLQLGQLAKSGINLLDEMATKYHKTQAEIALKWLVAKENVLAIPKSTNKEHIDQLLDLFTWEISKNDLELLSSDFPVQILTSDCIAPITSFER